MKPQNPSTSRAPCNDTDPIGDCASLDLHSHQWVAASAASLGPRQTLLQDKLGQCHPQARTYLLALSNFSYPFLYFFKHVRSTHYTEAACFGDLNSSFFPFSPGTSSFRSFSSKQIQKQGTWKKVFGTRKSSISQFCIFGKKGPFRNGCGEWRVLNLGTAPPLPLSVGRIPRSV